VTLGPRVPAVAGADQGGESGASARIVPSCWTTTAAVLVVEWPIADRSGLSLAMVRRWSPRAEAKVRSE
jgi:hypothetical protein